MILNEDTIKHLSELYESISLENAEPEDVTSNDTITEIHDIISSLKFVQDLHRTGKLWVQFMDFVSIIWMFIRAERTGNWQLHLHATELMLSYFAAAGQLHKISQEVLSRFQVLVRLLESKIQRRIVHNQ